MDYYYYWNFLARNLLCTVYIRIQTRPFLYTTVNYKTRIKRIAPSVFTPFYRCLNEILYSYEILNVSIFDWDHWFAKNVRWDGTKRISASHSSMFKQIWRRMPVTLPKTVFGVYLSPLFWVKLTLEIFLFKSVTKKKNTVKTIRIMKTGVSKINVNLHFRQNHYFPVIWKVLIKSYGVYVV